MKKIAVVMAGGLGLRFWPRSTEKAPKQFIHLTGDGTMIQNTFQRLQNVFPIEDIYIVTFESLAGLVREQLPELPESNIMLEPFGRNTAPCIALAWANLAETMPEDTVMAVFPSDHIIFNIREFVDSVEAAAQTAYSTKGLVTIGVNPSRPETQYGYVQIKEERGALGELYDKGARRSTTFAEKPDLGTARRFLQSGDFLWNSGIFCWRLDTLISSFERYLPEHSAQFKILRKHAGKPSYYENLLDTYKQINAISVDYGILEKADNVYVIESSFRWSDLGTWDELYRISLKDASNNVIEGDVIPMNTSNCLVNSSGRMIGIVGVEDLIVIDSDEALLICRRGDSDSVNEIINFMRRKHINKLL